MLLSVLTLCGISNIAPGISAGADTESPHGQPVCHSSMKILKREEDPDDKSWTEYLRSVYITNDTSKVDRDFDSINFLYRNGPVEASAPEWHHKKPLVSLESDWGDTYFRYSDKTYLSDEWAEVSRYSTTYLQKFRGASDEWVEGLSRGMSGKYTTDQAEVPYGCWFNLARGSGIFVNVGKTIVARRKYDYTLYAMLGLTSKGCLLDSHSSHENCYDRYLCSAALKLGIQSVQIMDHSEVVICSGKCATEPLPGTCPQLELRSGVGASKSCTCSDEKYLLNCDGGAGNTTKGRDARSVNKAFIDPVRRAQSQAQLSDPSRHRTCLPRHPASPGDTPFNLTIAFTSGMLHHAVSALPKLHRTLQRFPAAETMLLDVGGDGAGESRKHSASFAVQALSSMLVSALNSTVGKTTARRLHGHHHHHDHHDHHDHHSHGEEEGEDHYTPDFDRGADRHHHSNNHDRHHDDDHHPDHDHSDGHGREDRSHGRDHHRHSDEEQEPVVSSADPVYAALFEAGYRAVGLDPSYAALRRSPALPVLEINSSTTQRAAVVVAANGVRVGLMAHRYAGANRTQSELEVLIRQIQDETVCLKKMGANLVVLMANGGDIASIRRVAEGTKGYLDAIISAPHLPYSCQGQWHGSSNGVVIVQISSDPDSVGVLNVYRDSAGYAFRSDVLYV